ncbi:MAG: cation diffusion facilitator family transporter [Elusimicrobia bacterium]|nr:cation diffusion facilitator family transporter [Elusimicrobiota bacterium]
MRVFLAVVLVLASPGLECYQALAASTEKPAEPGRLPEIVPKIAPAAGDAAARLLPVNGAELPVIPVGTEIPTAPAEAGLGGAQAGLSGTQVVLPEAQAGLAETRLESPEAPPEAGIVGALETAERGLEKTLDKPSVSPESVTEAAAVFEKAKPSSSPLGFIARVTGLAPLWTSASRKLAVQTHADRLIESKSSFERAASARKLGELKSRETIEVLGEKAASDPDPNMREAAKKALAAAGRDWTPILLKELRLHPLPGRRAAAARSLGWIARFSDETEVVDALGRQAAVDLRHDVRLTAIQALSRAQSPKALATLIEIRSLATKPDIISASEVAINEAIAFQQASGRDVAPYHPTPGEFGSSKQPLYALALKRVIAVSAVFTAIEFVGGLMIGSLSLKADSMHLLADLGINVGALFALWMSRRPPNSHKTYGYLKMESLTGLLSAAAIAAMALFTLTEALPRLWAPVAVPGLATVALAFSGLLSNAISTLLLYRYQEDSLSLKGAFLHAATDAIGSVGIIAAGALIYFFHWFIADPIISFLIVGLIIHTTWGLAKRSWNVLIDAVPPDVKIDELEGDLLAVPSVASVYDLHVWSLNSSEKALTAILYVKPGGDLEKVLTAAKAVVREKHSIGHATLQVEFLKPQR